MEDRAFDDVPEHWFLVEEVLDDCVTGVAVTGPLAGEYGEPEIPMILRVLTSDEVALGRHYPIKPKRTLTKSAKLSTLGQRPQKKDASALTACGS